MNPIINNNAFFVKEHTGVFKAANNYDIHDPETRDMWMTCREENLGFFTKLFRFTKYKRATPFNIVIKDLDGNKILTVKKGTTFFGAKVQVLNENDEPIGSFNQNMWSFSANFKVMDNSEKEICQLKGKWSSWDVQFMKGDTEFAKVSKKWGGLGKELFTTADDYILSISDVVPQDNPIRLLILAAVISIDMVLRE